MKTKVEKENEVVTTEQVNEVETTEQVDVPNIFTPHLDAPISALAIAHQREQKLKAIRFLEIPNMASSKLVGEEFDILDAVRSRFNDEINVAFIVVVKSSGEKFSVKKPLNVFTEAYLDYFESFAEGETAPPMVGYTFAQLDEGGKAGNKPIVLRKL